MRPDKMLTGGSGFDGQTVVLTRRCLVTTEVRQGGGGPWEAVRAGAREMVLTWEREEGSWGEGRG
jgi:hypothetical protein